MMFYTTVGLGVAAFFLVSAEDIMIQDSSDPLMYHHVSGGFLIDLQARSDSTTSLPNLRMSYDGNEGTVGHEFVPHHPKRASSPTRSQTLQSLAHVVVDTPLPFEDSESLEMKIWNVGRIVFWICSWWFGCSALFAYFEGWDYFDAVYFAFVSMTGIWFGDLTIRTPVALEVWWIFLFNAVS